MHFSQKRPQTQHALIAIRYDKDKNNFLAVCGFHMNHIMNKIPSRRFRRRTRDWVIPNLRLNCRAIAEYESSFVFEDRESKDEYNKTLATQVNSNMEKFPLGFDYKLPPKPKQLEALNQLYGHPYGAVFSKAGTGKSKIACDLNVIRHTDSKMHGWLIVCPFYVRHNWLVELDKFIKVKYSPYVFETKGWTKTRQKEFDAWLSADNGFKIGIVGYESLKQRDREANKPTGRMYPMVERFLLHGNVGITADESHHIKNWQSNVTRNVTELGLMSSYKLIMTGTPVTKDSLDLFGQYNFLSPNILGVDNYYSFRNRYAEMGGFENKEIVGLANQEELAELVAPLTFQCTLREMGGKEKEYMPPRQFVMTADQKKAYDEVKRGRIIKGDDITTTVENILQVYLAMQQICNGFVSYTEETVIGEGEDAEVIKDRRIRRIVEPKANPKLKLIQSMADDIDPDEPIVVWSKFNQTLGDWVELVGEDKSSMYCGLKTAAELEIEREKWLDGETRFLAASPNLAGTGLNWLSPHAANAIYIDNTYKYIDREQTEGRTNRLTSDEPCKYWDVFPVGGLVDNIIYQSVLQKKNVAQYVEDNIETCLAELGIK